MTNILAPSGKTFSEEELRPSHLSKTFSKVLGILPDSDTKEDFLRLGNADTQINTEGYKHAIFRLLGKLPDDAGLRFSALATTEYGLPVAIALTMHHISVSAVSLVLHRDETHGAVELDPLLKAVAKPLIRTNSTIVAKEWVAAHTQHHPQSDNMWDEDSSVLGDSHPPEGISEKPGFKRNIKHFFGGSKEYYQAIDVIYKHSENDIKREEIHKNIPKTSVRILGDKPGKIERYGPSIALFASYVTIFGWKPALLMAFIQGTLGSSAVVTVNGLGHGAEEKSLGARGDYSTNIADTGDTITGKLINDINNFVTAGEGLFHGNHHINMKSADFTFGDPKSTDIGYHYIQKLEECGLAWDIKASTVNAAKIEK